MIDAYRAHKLKDDFCIIGYTTENLREELKDSELEITDDLLEECIDYLQSKFDGSEFNADVSYSVTIFTDQLKRSRNNVQ